MNRYAATALIALLAASPGDTANRYSRQILGMEPAAQRGLFRKLMTSSGETCASVTRVLYRGASRTMDMWNIRCVGSGDWAVSIEADSSTKILHCGVLKMLKSPCWTVFKK